MLDKNTVNLTIIHKAVAVVRKMSADEQLLHCVTAEQARTELVRLHSILKQTAINALLVDDTEIFFHSMLK